MGCEVWGMGCGLRGYRVWGVDCGVWIMRMGNGVWGIEDGVLGIVYGV